MAMPFMTPLARSMLVIFNACYAKCGHYQLLPDVDTSTLRGHDEDLTFLRVADIGAYQPASRKAFVLPVKVRSSWVEFVQRLRDVAAFPSLVVRMSEAALKEPGIGIRKFAKNNRHGFSPVCVAKRLSA